MLILQLHQVAAPAAFRFKQKAPARKWFEDLSRFIAQASGDAPAKVFTIEDDWGRAMTVSGYHVENVTLVDLALDLSAQCDQQFMQSEAQQRLNTRLQHSPMSRLVGSSGLVS